MSPMGKRGLKFTVKEIKDLLALIDDIVPIANCWEMYTGFVSMVCILPTSLKKGSEIWRTLLFLTSRE
jgi:hypothetical protein